MKGRTMMVVLLGLIVAPIAAFAVPAPEEFQKAGKKKLVLDCAMVTGFEQLIITKKGKYVGLPAAAEREVKRIIPKKMRYYACGLSGDGLPSLFAKKTADSTEIVELRYVLEDFKELKGLKEVCKKIVPMPGGWIYKTIGSGHLPKEWQDDWGLIASPGAVNVPGSCIKAYDSDGHLVGRAGIYGRNDPWTFRGYAFWGCGLPMSGKELAARATKKSKSPNVYFTTDGNVCFGPQHAGVCKGSTQC